MHKKINLNIQQRKFLKDEGDQMFKRNKHINDSIDFDKEKLTETILNIYKNKKIKKNTNSILEIGCGNGARLEFLSKKLKKKIFYGIDPSALAIKKAKSKKIKAKIGTADFLPYSSNKFEMLIFGFCLYLVDDNDLFKVICEADRVLKKNGIIIIYDFDSDKPRYKSYKHCKNLKSRHMSYKNFFITHPLYKLISEKKFIYEEKKSIQIKDTFLNISCILKN